MHLEARSAKVTMVPFHGNHQARQLADVLQIAAPETASLSEQLLERAQGQTNGPVAQT